MIRGTDGLKKIRGKKLLKKGKKEKEVSKWRKGTIESTVRNKRMKEGRKEGRKSKPAIEVRKEGKDKGWKDLIKKVKRKKRNKK